MSDTGFYYEDEDGNYIGDMTEEDIESLPQEQED